MNNTSLQSTINETSEVAAIKRGRGRPSGSNSFENIQIKELLNLLSPEASIPVSKKWLRDTLGLMVAAAPVKVITAETPAVEEVAEEQEKVEFAVHDFSEEGVY
jgi:hypothetical protein